MSRNTQEELVQFVNDMYSVELQALVQMKAAPKIAGDEAIASAFRLHEQETEQQAHAIRQRLEALGGKPSVIKDAVMKLGGKSFLLFAKLQPETPGKLLVHAYSYEAMEWAGYQLLSVLAGRANDLLTADTAKGIAAEERTMMTRIEQLFDAAERASHADTKPEDMLDHLRAHLGDEHALAEQNIKLLEKGTKMAGNAALTQAYRQSMRETQRHAEQIEHQLIRLGSDASATKDSALRLGALNWSLFFKSQTDTPAKLAAFAYAIEHLLIGGAEMLLRTAERANDREVALLCETMIQEQKAMAQRIADNFDNAIQSTLREVA